MIHTFKQSKQTFKQPLNKYSMGMGSYIVKTPTTVMNRSEIDWHLSHNIIIEY